MRWRSFAVARRTIIGHLPAGAFRAGGDPDRQQPATLADKVDDHWRCPSA
jgi:hypothetical protein